MLGVHEMFFNDHPLEVCDDFEELAVRAAAVPYDPVHVRLRGFILIEYMLEYLDERYNKDYRTVQQHKVPLRLGMRTWGSLTQIKQYLDVAIDELQLDVAEARLGGVEQDHLTQVTSGFGDPQQVTQSVLGTHLRGLFVITSNAIRMLRPYLRNDRVAVSGLGDQIYHFIGGVYGVSCGAPMLEFVKKIVDAKL
jgi:hypothetical protein